MAYANLLGHVCTGGKAEFIKRLRDFICSTGEYEGVGIGGWFVYDSYYAVNAENLSINDWFVLRSTGTSGRDDMYMYLKWAGSSYIAVQGWLFWNNITSVGTQYFNNSLNNMILSDTASNPELWIYGNEDSVWLTEGSISTYRTLSFGKLKSVTTSEDILYNSASETIGTNKILTMDNELPSDWIVGNSLFIWDDNGVQKVMIEAVDAATKQITVALTKDIQLQSKISRHLGYYTQAISNLSINILINKAGTSPTSAASAAISVFNYVDTLDINTYNYMPQALAQTTGGVLGEFQNIRLCQKITPLVHKDVLVEDDGTEWRFFDVYGAICCCREV